MLAAMEIQREIGRLHRAHYRALVAPLIRILGGFEAAEDVVQDTFAKALVVWARDGLPDAPLAWLRRTARNGAIDRYRRQGRWRAKATQIAAQLAVEAPEQAVGRALDEALDGAHLADDTLRLVFTCCHPSLAPEAQIGLTLRTVCGLTSDQVARAFLVQRATLQQRLVRAQRKIDRAGIRYAVPGPDELEPRLAAVLHTVYLVFTEGYVATDGENLLREGLCEEAIRLGRLLQGLLPERAEVQGLLALMLLHHARRAARTDGAGDLVLLEAQDRGLWDRALIDEALPRVEAALRGRPVSTYALEAAIAALHARAPTAADTDWMQIAALYAVLERTSGHSPVVRLNAAVAVAMAGGLEAGLARLDALADEPALARSHRLPAARADLLRRAGRVTAARAAYREALARAGNPVEARFLARRLAALGGATEEIEKSDRGGRSAWAVRVRRVHPNERRCEGDLRCSTCSCCTATRPRTPSPPPIPRPSPTG